MPLADRFDGFLVDFDGVVWVGRDPVPGSPEALNELRAAGKRLVFVTNNPSRLPAAYAEKLAGFGVEAEPEQIVTAGMAAARLAVEAAGEGRPRLRGRRAGAARAGRRGRGRAGRRGRAGGGRGRSSSPPTRASTTASCAGRSGRSTPAPP